MRLDFIRKGVYTFTAYQENSLKRLEPAGIICQQDKLHGFKYGIAVV